MAELTLIDNGQPVNETQNDAWLLSLNTALIAAINQQENGDDTLTYENIVYSLNTKEQDLTNSTAYNGNDNFIVFAPYIDKTNDSSIDATLWTTATTSGGSVTEDTVKIRTTVTTNSTSSTGNNLISDGSTAIDLKDADSELVFYADIDINKSNANVGTATISIIGSTGGSATIKTVNSSGGNADDETLYRVVIDVAGTEMSIYEDGAITATSTVDLSSLTGASWYLKINASLNGGTGSGTTTIDLFGIARVKEADSESELTYLSDGFTLDVTATSAYGFFRYVANENVPKISFSADGSTFGTDVADKEGVVNGLTTGTNGKIRIKETIDSSITTNYPLPSAPIIQAWGAQFR